MKLHVICPEFIKPNMDFCNFLMRSGHILALFCLGYPAKNIFDPRDLVSRVKQFECYESLVNDSERKMTMVQSRSRYTRLALAELNFRSGDSTSPGSFLIKTTIARVCRC